MNELILCAADVDAIQVLQDYCARNPQTPARAVVCNTNQQLVAMLTQNRRQHAASGEQFFLMKTTEGPRLCPLSDIMYCQSDAHRYRVLLADGTLLTSTNGRCRFFEMIEPLLQDRRFLPCGRSLVVNTGYIARVDRCQVTLYGGEILTLPTHRQAEFRTALAGLRA